MVAAVAMIACGTALRPPASNGETPIVRLASDAGYPAIALDGGCYQTHIAPTTVEALKAGLQVVAVFAPMGPKVLDPGRRLPYLGAPDDAEERLAAIRLVRTTLEGVRELGVTLAAVDVGELALHAKPADLRRAFARRELGEHEAGHRLLGAMLAERRAASEAVMDACRSSLERVARVAERLTMTLALQVGAFPWQIPSPREAAALIAEFRGAPLALTLSPGRLAVLDALGVGGGVERRALVATHARLIHLTDAVGLEHDLLPGLGEASMACEAPEETPIVVSGRADSSVRELVEARALAEQSLRRTAGPATAS